MGSSKTAQAEWMAKNGNANTTTDNVFAGAGGWYVKHQNGQVELLQAMTGAAELIVNPANIQSILNPPVGEYDIDVSDVLTFVVNWSEPVDISGAGGIPTVNFTVGGTAKTAAISSGAAVVTKQTQSTFNYTVETHTGAIVMADPSVVLNSGTIKSGDQTPADLTPVFDADTVDSITVNVGGSGYVGNETITIDDPNKSNSTATITTTDDGDAVDSVVLEDGGYGYEDGTIAIAGGTGGTVTATTTDGVITGIVLLAGGTGYTGATGVELASPTLTVTTATADITFATGSIVSFAMTEVGYGYDGLESYTMSAEPLAATATFAQPSGYVDPTATVVDNS